MPASTSTWLEQVTEPEAQPIAAAPDDPRAVALRGRLTVRQRPWIHPAGVTVRLTRHWLDTVLPTEASDAAVANDREPTAVTQPDGSFVLSFLPLSGELFFLIDRGGSWMDYQRVPRVPAAGATDLGDVWLDDRGRVRGVVLDAMDQPLANVRVRAVDEALNRMGSGLDDLREGRLRGADRFAANGATALGPLPPWVARRDRLLPFPAALTGADGSFELRGLRPGVQDLFLQHEHGHGSLGRVQVAMLRTTDVGEVRLHHNESAALTFVDVERQPWIGAAIAFVDAELGFGPAVERTNAKGEVHATVASRAGTQVLFAHPGGGPWFRVGSLADMPTPVTVPQPANVRVQLLTPEGQSLIGGQVRFFVTGAQFRPVDRRLPAWMQPTEVQPGLHAGKGVGRLIAIASAPDRAPAIAEVDSDAVYQMTLLPLQRLTVRVRDSAARPIAGATVRLQVHRHPDQTFCGAQWDALANDRVRVGTTDEHGLVEVPVWATWFSLQALHPDFAPSAGPHFVPKPGAVVDMTLLHAGAITGVLTMQRRPAPPGFRVRARQLPPPGNPLDGSGFLAEHVAATGDDGSFAFRGLCAGIWDLQPELPPLPAVDGARHPAAAFVPTQVLLDEGQALHCVLEANRPLLSVPQLAGVVRQDGAALAGALVRVRELARSAPAGKRRRTTRTVSPPSPPAVIWQQQCTTDWFGDFDFANLERDAEYEVRVDVPCNDRLQFVRRYVVRTSNDEVHPTTRLDVDLTTGSVRLQCSADGRPFAGRMIRLRQVLDQAEDGACFELLTDDYGECVADGLLAGTWTMEPVHGGSLEPAEFTLHTGEIRLCVAQHRP